MKIDVVLNRDVQLHHRLIVSKKQPLYMIHFRPVGAAVCPAHRHMLPTFADRCDDGHWCLIDGRWYLKRAAGIVANIAKQADHGSIGAAELIEKSQNPHDAASPTGWRLDSSTLSASEAGTARSSAPSASSAAIGVSS